MSTTQPWILMCRPEHYGIEYEINAWMSRERPANRELAAEQWQRLHEMLIAAGARISLLEPQPGLPDLVFTANAAMIYERTAVLSRFRHEVRQRETPHDEQWFREAGFAIKHLPAETYFEGAGDALFCGDTLFAGYRIRSDALGQQQVGAELGVRVIPVELVDPYYYHLDTCFCPLAPGEAIWYPGAFDEYGRRAIEQLVDRLIEVSADEAQHFACNAVVVERTVVTNTGCPRLHAALAAAGYAPRETPLSEFVKAGGSAKCLTLRLDGEEAAAWRTSV
ncbi:MAG: dimethylarginine dimethylaminohydrolase family protein [Pirellulales bacterium]